MTVVGAHINIHSNNDFCMIYDSKSPAAPQQVNGAGGSVVARWPKTDDQVPEHLGDLALDGPAVPGVGGLVVTLVEGTLVCSPAASRCRGQCRGQVATTR